MAQQDEELDLLSLRGGSGPYEGERLLWVIPLGSGEIRLSELKEEY